MKTETQSQDSQKLDSSQQQQTQSQEVYRRKSRRLELQKDPYPQEQALNHISPDPVPNVTTQLPPKPNIEKKRRVKTMAKRTPKYTTNYYGRQVVQDTNSQEYVSTQEENESIPSQEKEVTSPTPKRKTRSQTVEQFEFRRRSPTPKKNVTNDKGTGSLQDEKEPEVTEKNNEETETFESQEDQHLSDEENDTFPIEEEQQQQNQETEAFTSEEQPDLPDEQIDSFPIQEEQQLPNEETETFQSQEEAQLPNQQNESFPTQEEQQHPNESTKSFPTQEESQSPRMNEEENEKQEQNLKEKQTKKKQGTSPIQKRNTRSQTVQNYELKKRGPGIKITDVTDTTKQKRRKLNDGKLKKKVTFLTPESTISSPSSCEFVLDEDGILTVAQKNAMKDLDNLVESITRGVEEGTKFVKSPSEPETSKEGEKRSKSISKGKQDKVKKSLVDFSSSITNKILEATENFESFTKEKSTTTGKRKKRSAPSPVSSPSPTTSPSPSPVSLSSTSPMKALKARTSRTANKKPKVLEKSKQSGKKASIRSKEIEIQVQKLRNPRKMKNKFITICKEDGTRLEKDFHTGCTTKKFVNLREKLTDRQKEDIEEIGFGNLLYINITKLPSKILMWLISNFDPYLKIQTVGTNKYYVSIFDVHDILGLPKEGLDVNLLLPKKTELEVKENWMNEYNKKQNEDIYLNEVFDKMMELKNGGEKFKKLFAIYSISAFLAPTARKIVDVRMLSVVENVEVLGEINWSAYILERLCNAVAKFKKSANTTQVSGCVVLLLMAYLYRFPLEGKIDPLDLPLIRNWDDSILIERVNKLRESGFENGIMVKKVFPLSKDESKNFTKEDSTSYTKKATFTAHHEARPSSSGSKGVISYSIPSDLPSNEEIISSKPNENQQAVMIFYRDMEIITRHLIDNLRKSKKDDDTLANVATSPTSPETQRILNDPQTHELVDKIVENYLKSKRNENDGIPSFDLGLDDLFCANNVSSPNVARNNVPVPNVPSTVVPTQQKRNLRKISEDKRKAQG